MNDRYLFKAKRKMWRKFPKEEHWIVWDAITGKPSEAILNETICQCTGLKDKSGNLIWENDIVTNEERVGIVKFGEYSSSFFGSNAHLGFYIEWLKNEYLREDIMFWKSKIRSVANIFDNPELLEVE